MRSEMNIAQPGTNVLMLHSTANGWFVTAQNGIRLSGYYPSGNQACEAVRKLIPDALIEFKEQNHTGRLSR